MSMKGNKRIASISVSPQKCRSTCNSSPLHNNHAGRLNPPPKKQNKKSSYKFAPINKLTVSDVNVLSNVKDSTLRTISISQVRNSSNDKEDRKRFPISASKNEHNAKQSKVSVCTEQDSNNDEFGYSGDGPSEEVIWMFSPVKETVSKDVGDKQVPMSANGSPILIHEYSSDSEDDFSIHNDSSTPMVPNKFKTLLTFPNVQSNDSLLPPNSLKRDSMRSATRGLTPTPFSESKEKMRDIDDIINDIVGDFGLKPTQIPSSPIKSEVLTNKSKNKQRTLRTSFSQTLPAAKSQTRSPIRYSFDVVDIESSDNDDDSLIDILTQKFSKRKVSHSPTSSQIQRSSAELPISISSQPPIQKGDLSQSSQDSQSIPQVPKCDSIASDMNDDSLIDYLEENHMAQKPHICNVAKAVVKVKEDNKKENISTLSGSSESNITDLPKWMGLAKCGYRRKGLSRLVVISTKEFNLPSGPKQKVLTCINDKGAKSNVILRAPWVQLSFEPGDVIHIIEGKNCKNKRLLSDDKDPVTKLHNDNLMIVHPDLLVSATSMGSSIECLRKSVLNFQFMEPGVPSIQMTIGSIVHELLQELLEYKLKHPKIDDSFIESTLDEIISKHRLSILLCKETEEFVKETIRELHVDNMKQFVMEYVQVSNYQCRINVAGKVEHEKLSLSKIIDIEENILSPMYGMKGYIDATVETHIGEGTKLIAPLEIKTGKAKLISHEAQGTIYTMLLNDRYDVPIEFHLMYYSRTNEFMKQPRLLQSLKHLLVLRNRLAQHLKHNINEIQSCSEFEEMNIELPPLLQHSTCDSCYHKRNCMVLNKISEDGSAEQSSLPEGEYNELTSHLENGLSLYQQFYKKFNRLLCLEESSLNSMTKEMFLMDGKSRELSNGRCLHGLVLDSISQVGGLYYCKLVRDNAVEISMSMLNSQIAPGDMVYISDEVGHFCLSTGHVKEISKEYITITCRRRFDMDNVRGKDFNAYKKQVIESVLTQSGPSLIGVKNPMIRPLIYRIDKNDVHFGLSMARFNLLNLFLPAVDPTVHYLDDKGEEVRLKRWQGGDTKTRRLLVDGKPPRFSKKSSISYVLDDNKFNRDQAKAIDKVMRCKDYALILGMPGTGKTTVVAELIKILTKNGKSVLLASYTHSAVDNILLKLLDAEVRMIRLGHIHKLHPKVRHLVPDFDKTETHDQLAFSLNEPQVVATTCLGINDPMLNLRNKDFDYVILDEASQVSLPIALGPIRFGEKFILVGDHYQLPPLVKNEIAKEKGLEETLFKTLCQRHPASVTELTIQYRMNTDIMALSNELIYNGKLKCGNDSVANQTLAIQMDIAAISNPPWLRDVLDPQRKVVLLDYGDIPDMQEMADKDNIRNPGEARLVKLIIEGLISLGVSTLDIGVMTLYRSQLRLLRSELLPHSNNNHLEILTADQFQGRDKECIIISMVRSNDKQNAGLLLRELRRVNVAMSRAKSKLILICSKRTICNVKEIHGFLRLVERNGWVYPLRTSS
ncbi:bifunctional ATP-dependent DNA helicase/ssDNA endodeoxyribonuclease DNA2 Ecym_5575 [Eremothecium cymbalariae DBVPG|uniref:DNA replication ATP-dependent helicase/nuclease DNA2 n=1 Tax=Eremothecium cymbalariae (strain CBS 270.75 / DBVPG 7215 / KCTC 17166 / NRRL Y-17582) TaxID=931890 RepID=I6NE21_ERECY|nr:hypothetical protein Ecym_5575 [Eremothecium cymbalariae DBVPG\